MQIRECLQAATHQLEHASDTDSARLDAELLLAHCLNKKRSYLYTWPERTVDAADYHCFSQLLQQRLQGTPIAYLLGYREFWGLELHVSPATLIPRPDTEWLVELALAKIPPHQPAHILDLGTGSGAIAIALAKERPLATVLATDRSRAALEVARSNAARLQLDNLQFLQADWFQTLPACAFDLIVSNPPYIATDDPHLQQGDVRFEPLSALSSGTDGLDDIRHLVSAAPRFLAPEGWLLFEHGYDQGAVAGDLLRTAHYREVSCHPDWGGNDRVSGGQCPL